MSPTGTLFSVTTGGYPSRSGARRKSSALPASYSNAAVIRPHCGRRACHPRASWLNQQSRRHGADTPHTRHWKTCTKCMTGQCRNRWVCLLCQSRFVRSMRYQSNILVKQNISAPLGEKRSGGSRKKKQKRRQKGCPYDRRSNV